MSTREAIVVMLEATEHFPPDPVMAEARSVLRARANDIGARRSRRFERERRQRETVIYSELDPKWIEWQRELLGLSRPKPGRKPALTLEQVVIRRARSRASSGERVSA